MDTQLKVKSGLRIVDNCIDYRENIEWANFWWESANKNVNNRVLLIGDSTSRHYRSTLAHYINRPVDFMGTSSNILDSLFVKELELFFDFKEYKYSDIQIQIGCHGITDSRGQQIQFYDGYYELYKKQYEKIASFLLTKCSNLVIASSTHIIEYKESKLKILQSIYTHFHSRKSEKIDLNYNEGLLMRNGIVQEVARKYSLKFNDLYNYMLNEGKVFKHTDHVHFQNSSKIFIAKKVAQYLSKDC